MRKKKGRPTFGAALLSQQNRTNQRSRQSYSPKKETLNGTIEIAHKTTSGHEAPDSTIS